MSQQVAATTLVMEAPSLLPKKRTIQKASKKDRMKESEDEALSYFKRHHDDKDDDPSLESKYATAIKKSPSALSIDLGILFAVEADWCNALEELLQVDMSRLSPITSKELNRHPLWMQIMSSPFSPPSASNSSVKHNTDSALLYAITTKRVEAVRILLKHLNPNLEDMQGRPLSYYLFSVDDRVARRQMADIILPKMRPSLENLRMAATYGDLEGTIYIMERIHPKDKYRAVLAGTAAILHDHDELARWVIEKSGVVDWNEDGSGLVEAAIERDNIGMIELLAELSPALPITRFGNVVATELWKYLRKVNRFELFEKFIYPPPHPSQILDF